MATREEIESWILQAEADLRAARVMAEGIAECHRRYWFQQSYEKAIKALGLILWEEDSSERKAFEDLFLYTHAPLTRLQKSKGALPKTLHALERQILVEIRDFDNAARLLQIDAAEPSKNPDQISYRYPFRQAGQYIAPAAYEESEWGRYQGNAMGVDAAVQRLLKYVKDELKTFLRRPS